MPAPLGHVYADHPVASDATDPAHSGRRGERVVRRRLDLLDKFI